MGESEEVEEEFSEEMEHKGKKEWKRGKAEIHGLNGFIEEIMTMNRRR